MGNRIEPEERGLTRRPALHEIDLGDQTLSAGAQQRALVPSNQPCGDRQLGRGSGLEAGRDVADLAVEVRRETGGRGREARFRTSALGLRDLSEPPVLKRAQEDQQKDENGGRDQRDARAVGGERHVDRVYAFRRRPTPGRAEFTALTTSFRRLEERRGRGSVSFAPMTKRATFLSGIGLLVLLAAFAGRGLAAGPGDLSGTWSLNRELSDDPREKMREARESGGGGPGRGGGFRGHRRGGGAGGLRGRRRDGDAEGGSADSEDMTHAFEKLFIVHRDPELRITDGFGREHVLYTDDRRIEEERSAGTVKIRARWKDGHVVVTTTPEHGSKIIETYAVTADGSVLTVTTSIEGRGREISFRRVYDPVR